LHETRIYFYAGGGNGGGVAEEGLIPRIAAKLGLQFTLNPVGRPGTNAEEGECRIVGNVVTGLEGTP